MQKYRDRGTGGGMAAPLFQWIIKKYQIKSSVPAWSSSHAILPPPPALQKRLRVPVIHTRDYSTNKCYTIKMNLYTKDVIYVFKHQNLMPFL
jgi:hypothetical protein